MTASARIRGTLPVYARWRWSTPQGFTFTLGDQIINDRVASFSFAVPTGIVGRVRVSLTNMVGGSFQFAATNAFVTVLEDSDGDHIPDIYERANGMDENNPNDAAADPDGDTMSNSDEYIAGTDPQDGGSYLRVERVEATGSATIYFRAISNRTYSVQYSDKISPALWERLQDVLARPTNYSAVVSDPESRPQRFYRLVTPPPLP